MSAIETKRIAAIGEDLQAAQLPPTRGVWRAIIRGKRSAAPTVTGWIELFAHNEGGPLVSIPGVSRFISVSQKEGK